MIDFVLDCSVALAWFYQDGDPVYVPAVFELFNRGHRAIVPPLWRYEIANGLVTAQRYKRVDEKAIADFLDTLDDVSIVCVGQPDPQKPLADIMPEVKQAMSSGLTAYDNAYLVTAMQLQLPLATLDKDLRRAARAAGIADAVKGSPRT